MSFRLARLGRRGFDEDDVRDFCDRVEGELSLLLEERTALQAEVRRLRGWAQAINQRRARVALPPGVAPASATPASAAPSGAAPLGRGPAGHGPSAIGPPGAGPLGAGQLAAGPLSAPVSLPAPSPSYGHQVAQSVDPNEQALRILAKAQQTAERYVSDAHAYSQEVAHEAQRRRDKILAEASTKATDMLEHAHQVAIRNNLTPDTDRARQPAPRPAPTPAPPNYSDYSDIAARYPTATRDYRALHRHDPRPACDTGSGLDPRPAYGSEYRLRLGPVRSSPGSGPRLARR